MTAPAITLCRRTLCLKTGGFGIKFANDAQFNVGSQNQVTGGYYGLILDNRLTNNTFSDNRVSNANFGIYTDYPYNDTITGNEVIDSINQGITVQPGINNTVSNNIVHGGDSAIGIFVGANGWEDTTGNLITNNTVYNLHQAIYLQGVWDNSHFTYGNTISANNLTSVNTGIMLDNANCSTIFGNTVFSNYECVDVCNSPYSSGNIIYANNFISYGYESVHNEASVTNIWDYNGQGNYWSDYLDQNPDATSTSGIWNTPYTTVDSLNSVDHYPLVNPIGLYILNITKIGRGNPSLTTGFHYELPNSQIQVTANPTDGKAFLHWTLDSSQTTDNPLTVTMNANHNLIAVFEVPTWSLTVEPATNGVIQDSGQNRIDGTTLNNLADNSQYALTAVPDAGYGFVNWQVNGDDEYGTTLHLTMNTNYDVQAVFAPGYTLTVMACEHGTVYSKFGEVEGTNLSVVAGDTYGLLAAPDSGYIFSHWVLDGQNYGSDNPIFLEMDASHTLQAVFTLPPLCILPTDPTPPSTNQILWTHALDSNANSPCVVNGVVYVSTEDGYVYAINATTNTQLWCFEADDDIYSSPTVVNGVVYVGSDDGYLYALNATTTNPNGEVLWAYQTDDYIESSPAVANGVVYFGTHDAHVYALNATTDNPDGEMLWSYEVSNSVFSSPAVVNGVVYVGTYDGNVYALTAPTSGQEGQELWCFATDDTVFSSPTVVNGVVYVGSEDGYVYALSAITDDSEGNLLWAYNTEGYVDSSPTVVNDVVYVGGVGAVYALDATTENPDGALIWQYNVEDRFLSRPVVTDGIVYINGYSGTVYALNATPESSDGDLIWSYSPDEGIRWSSTSPTIDNGVLYFGSSDYNLYAFAANSKVDFTETGLTAGTSWSVTFDGITQTSTSNTITYIVCPNGQYSYSISLPDGYTTESAVSGTLTVTGEDISTAVTFASTQTATYTLTTKVYLNGNLIGTNATTYNAGQIRNSNFTELPAQYTFDHLSIDGTDSSVAAYSITMNSNHTLQLYFDTTTFQLTVTQVTGGTTDFPAQTQTYPYDMVGTVTATAAPGYTFSYWLIDGETQSTDNPISVTMQANHNLTPVFTEIPTIIVANDTTGNKTYTITIGGNITAQQMSNITITPYVNNSTTTVAFTVTGPSGTQGFGNITLPKEAIPYGTTPLVYIDGVLAENQSYVEDAANFYVSYSTHFSTHEISIVFTTAVTSSPTPTPTPNPTATPTPTPTTTQPTTTPQPTITPTTSPISTTQMGTPEYIAVIAAAVILIGIAIELVYRRKNKKQKS